MKTTESRNIIWMLLLAMVMLAACGSEDNYPKGLSLFGVPAGIGDSVIARLNLSDSEGRSLSYAWAVDGGWDLASGQGTPRPTLIAPSSVSATLSVTAGDDRGREARASLPLGMRGDDSPVLHQLYMSLDDVGPVTLAAQARDPDSQDLSYTWKVNGIAANGGESWLTSPVAGRYLLDVSVSDGSTTVQGHTQINIGGTSPWPFFRGTAKGTGSLVPVDTSSNTGTLKWRTTFTDKDCGAVYNFVSAAAQGQDGTLYVGSYSDGKLSAFNPATGAVKWSFAAAGSSTIRGTPAVAADGTIYVAGYDSGIVYAVNPDGSQKWQYASGANISSPIAIGADGTVYVGTDNTASSVLIALNPDGSLKWSFDLAAETRGSVNFGADGTVYARDYAGNLFAIDPANGSQKWQITRGLYSGSSPAVAADGTLYFGSFTGSATSRLYAANPADGSQKWESNLGGSLYGVAATASVGADGTVYIGSREGTGDTGKVYALDPTTGNVKPSWPYSLDYAASSTAIGADGTVYAASMQGTIYALDPDTGAEKWSYNTRQAGSGVNQNSPGPLTIGADGSIYAYTCEGVLHAIQ